MSTESKRAKLTTEELHQVKQLMGASLAMLSFWSLSALKLDGSALLLIGVMVGLLALLTPRWVASIPTRVWRWVGPIILLWIVGDFVLHQPEFISPLVRMVVLLIIYRLLAPRNHREDLQVILLCLFCVVISGVLTVSLLFAFQILLFTPLGMGLLFVVCLLDRGDSLEAYQPSWEHFNWKRMLRRVWAVLDFKVLSLGTLLFTFVVAVSTILFILTPRFDLEQAIPFLKIDTAARSGFSEDVQLGEVSEILQDNGVALRVDVPSISSIEATPYWRMLVLDKYEAGGFRLSDSLRAMPLRQFRQKQAIRSTVLPTKERSGAQWTFYMEGGMSRYLPVPGSFSEMRFQGQQDVEVVPDAHLYALDSVGQSVFSYQIEDLKFNRRMSAGFTDQEIFEGLPLEVAANDNLEYPLTCLELPIDPEYRELLSSINQELLGESTSSAAAYSQSVTNYLRGRFNYSLNPDGRGGDIDDPVVRWLTVGSVGHCEFFAASFVLLARDAGYPARMVVGFAGGSWNSVEDYFVVRNRDAHAWAEIYDHDQGNWLRVDPTPGNGSSDPEVPSAGGMMFESGWGAWLDSLRILWYRRVVNFEQKDQVELAMSLKDVASDYTDQIKAKLSAWMDGIQAWLKNPFDRDGLLVYAFGVCLVLGLFALWRLRYGFLAALFKVLRRPKSLDPVRRQASAYLKRLKARGLEDPVVQDLEALRFGPETTSQLARPIFEAARRCLRRR